MIQEERMLEMLKSERQDLESEVCQFRVMKAKLLQQITCVGISYLCNFINEQSHHLFIYSFFALHFLRKYLLVLRIFQSLL